MYSKFTKYGLNFINKPSLTHRIPIKSNHSFNFRRTFSTGGNVSSSGVSPAVAIGGGAALMFGTYWALNSILNKSTTFTESFGERNSTRVKNYMFNTYKYVGGGLAITAATATMAYRSGLAMRLMNANPWLVMGGSLVCTIGGGMLTLNTPPEQVFQKHMFWLATTGSIGALSLGTLGYFPAPLLIRAGAYTFGIVTSLSLIAMNAENDAFLYIGGPLYMGLGVVVCASIVSAFAPVGGRVFSVANNISLYGGLGLFSLFMLYDTQRVLQNARFGARRNPDYINESFHIYMNTLNIFIRMVQVLALGGNKKR